MRNSIYKYSGIILLAVVLFVIYLGLCDTSFRRCIYGGYLWRQIFFNLGLAFIVSYGCSLLVKQSVFISWLKAASVLIIILLGYIILSPESTNIGDPLPEREIAIFISSGIVFFWSVGYLTYKSYQARKNNS
jgi:Ni,Fe-hydrogenase I cytochrome b subunit